MSQLCKVDRDVGPTHCPAARQIEPGEAMYFLPYILTGNSSVPGTISGFCAYCLKIVLLFCIVVFHAINISFWLRPMMLI